MNPLQQLVFLDTETTGLGREDRLCQCAYIFDNDEYDELFLPEVPISVEAQSVSHITPKHVEGKPSFGGSNMQAHLNELLDQGVVLVAHNAPYDIEMLKRDGVEWEHYIDTQKVAKALDPEAEIPRYNMQFLRYFFELEVDDAIAHNALGDVRVLKALFEHLLHLAQESGRSEEEALAWMMEVSTEPQLVTRFTFGKHRGKKVQEVLMEDKGYLEWLWKQKQQQLSSGEITEQDEWVFTLRKLLGV